MNRKRTKIVATISDKRCEPEFLKELYEAGMDVIRINTAHQEIEGTLRVMENARKVSDKIPFLIDTKGPEIRTTRCDEPIQLLAGQDIRIIGDSDGVTDPGCIFVTYNNIANDLGEGCTILIDDGEIELKVKGVDGKFLNCVVLNDGVLGSRKSVNVPTARINLPSINDKDREYIDFAIDHDIDFIAHSFVRNKQDVMDVQAILDEKKSAIKIIAKIENQEGVDNIDEILDHVYGIMVARGDLAIEVPFEKIPGIQKMIINKCIEKRKPVIVATQMLHSMITNPRPTRAEVSDIANAVLSQTDAIMLSGETAYGKFPLEAVKAMTKVAKEVELNNKEKYIEMSSGNLTGEVSAYLAKVAVKTSIRIGSRGIVADTSRGRTIRNMAAFRGITLILAQCYSVRTMRELALSYGVYSTYQDKKNSTEAFIKTALQNITPNYQLSDSDIIVILAGNFVRGSGFSFIEVGTIEYLKSRLEIVS